MFFLLTAGESGKRSRHNWVLQFCFDFWCTSITRLLFSFSKNITWTLRLVVFFRDPVLSFRLFHNPVLLNVPLYFPQRYYYGAHRKPLKLLLAATPSLQYSLDCCGVPNLGACYRQNSALNNALSICQQLYNAADLKRVFVGLLYCADLSFCLLKQRPGVAAQGLEFLEQHSTPLPLASLSPEMFGSFLMLCSELSHRGFYSRIYFSLISLRLSFFLSFWRRRSAKDEEAAWHGQLQSTYGLTRAANSQQYYQPTQGRCQLQFAVQKLQQQRLQPQQFLDQSHFRHPVHSGALDCFTAYLFNYKLNSAKNDNSKQWDQVNVCTSCS